MTLLEELQVAGFEIIETHISCVCLRDRDVFKLKRAVNLGFLDFSSLEQRRQACLAEVRLNLRLAPDVYLGVVGLTRDAGGALRFLEHEACAGLEVLEWAVHMHRLRDEDRADSLLSAAALQPHDVEQLALRIAGFHRQARADEVCARLGGPEPLAQNVRENFRQLADLQHGLTRTEFAGLQRYQLGFLSEHAADLERRAEEGFVRDGHGDLRLEHCYRVAANEWRVIDCIEFNDRFRYGDVCADLAFLTMDFRHHGRIDYAELFVSFYARASGDYAVYRLLDFYESYRATVRGKVSAMLAQDSEVAAVTRAGAERESRRYLLQALASERRVPRAARFVICFGLIASGKSTMAQALSENLGWATLSADYTRKELLGVTPETPRRELAFEGAYGEQMTERVYETLFARASLIMNSGRSVIVDATFRASAHRSRASQLAMRHGAEILFVQCTTDRESALQRLAARAGGASVSDGRAEIFDAFAESFASPAELAPDQLLTLDTARPISENVCATLQRLQ